MDSNEWIWIAIQENLEYLPMTSYSDLKYACKGNEIMPVKMPSK